MEREDRLRRRRGDRLGARVAARADEAEPVGRVRAEARRDKGAARAEVARGGVAAGPGGGRDLEGEARAVAPAGVAGPGERDGLRRRVVDDERGRARARRRRRGAARRRGAGGAGGAGGAEVAPAREDAEGGDGGAAGERAAARVLARARAQRGEEAALVGRRDEVRGVAEASLGGGVEDAAAEPQERVADGRRRRRRRGVEEPAEDRGADDPRAANGPDAEALGAPGDVAWAAWTLRALAAAARPGGGPCVALGCAAAGDVLPAFAFLDRADGAFLQLTARGEDVS